MKKRMIVLDNGHGSSTPGKCSPDGRLREWAWTRRLARAIHTALDDVGIPSVLLVPGDEDMSLGARCRKVNAIAADYPDAILLSLHTNASGGNGLWGRASGWSVFVAEQSSERSRRLAKMLYGQAACLGVLGNRATPSGGFWTARFAILRNTVCPAVLTENMFHDNAADVDFLLSGRGFDTLVRLHVDGIVRFLEAEVGT